MKSFLNEIHEYLEKEQINEDLQKIPSDIYLKIAGHIKETRNISEEKSRDLISTLVRQERDLIVKITIRLLTIRLEKIMKQNNYLINGANLAPEEKYLIEASTISRKRFDKIRDAFTNGQTAFIRNVSKIISSKYIVVRFLQSSSSIIGIDFVKYGPYKKEDVGVIPLDNAKPLLKQKIVQEVDLDI
jgi:DNA replication factor GINS